MWQTSVAHEDRSPVTEVVEATRAVALVGGELEEPVDAEHGVWLVKFNPTQEAFIHSEGYLTLEVTGYIIEVDTP